MRNKRLCLVHCANMAPYIYFILHECKCCEKVCSRRSRICIIFMSYCFVRRARKNVRFFRLFLSPKQSAVKGSFAKGLKCIGGGRKVQIVGFENGKNNPAPIWHCRKTRFGTMKIFRFIFV